MPGARPALIFVWSSSTSPGSPATRTLSPKSEALFPVLPRAERSLDGPAVDTVPLNMDPRETVGRDWPPDDADHGAVGHGCDDRLIESRAAPYVQSLPIGGGYDVWLPLRGGTCSRLRCAAGARRSRRGYAAERDRCV